MVKWCVFVNDYRPGQGPYTFDGDAIIVTITLDQPRQIGQINLPISNGIQVYTVSLVSSSNTITRVNIFFYFPTCTVVNYTPHNEVEGGILESPWLYVCLSVCPSVCGHIFVGSCSPTVLHILL